MLLPALLIPFYILTSGFRGAVRHYMLAALLFSWIGDIMLLFQERAVIFFLLGLVSFLFAHVCFIIAFSKGLMSNRTSIIRSKPWLILLFLGYGAGFFFFIRTGLGDMMIPVIVYECIILLMGLSALNRYGRTELKSFQQVMAGALIFMISDSLLAVNKFYAPFLLASFLIMLTYILAQYFIVSGVVRYFLLLRLSREPLEE